MDYSKLTLGEFLSSENITIKRNAISILKIYQDSLWHCCSCDGIKLEYEAMYCENCFNRLSIAKPLQQSKNA
jgi:hypothetical protein